MKRFFILILILFSPFILAKEVSHELGTAKFDHVPTRVVALNWQLTETLLALDITPTAIADIQGYEKWVEYPALPADITDVGNRREPNLEAIKALKPDLILVSKEMAAVFEQLNAIAPTVSISIFTDQKKPLAAAKNMALKIGEIFDKQAAADALIAQTDAVIAKNAQAISSDLESLLFIRFLSERTVRVFGEGSLINDTITLMGLDNTWRESTNMWGFSKVGVSKLAMHQQARVMVMGPLSEAEQAQLKAAQLWQLMAFSKEERVHILPAIWTYGGLVAAQRFSENIATTLAK